jgi:hypothetical protein
MIVKWTTQEFNDPLKNIVILAAKLTQMCKKGFKRRLR